MSDENRRLFEYECYGCGYEEESADSPQIPLRECPECDDGRLHHVGPVIETCDECGSGLLFPGNPGLGGYSSETLCDTCYDRREALIADGGQPREARISKCQCGICDEIFTSGTVVEIAKKIARHWNQEHGRELRHSMEPFETVEYGGHHLHGDEYAIKRLDRYVTAYDVIDPGDGSPFKYRYAKAIESEDTCEDCWRPVDEVEEYREIDSDDWRDKFLCRSCHDERVVKRRREENVQLEAFERSGGEA